MGRKRKQSFGWVADGAEGEVPERVERPNRSAIKRHRAQISALVERLAALSPGKLRQLDLDEEQAQAILALSSAGQSTDRRRKLLHATSLLVDREPEELEAALKALG